MKYFVLGVLFTFYSFIPSIANSQNVNDLYKKGGRAMNNGNHGLAIKYFTEAYELTKDGEANTFLVLRGMAYLRADSNQKAISDLNIYINKNDSKAFPYILRAKAKKGIQDYVGAINDYYKAIEKAEPKTDLYTKSGLYHDIIKLKVASEMYSVIDIKKDYDKAISLNPKEPQIYIGAGRIYLLIYKIKKFNDSPDYKLRLTACSYFSKANELGSKKALDLIKKYCTPDNSNR